MYSIASFLRHVLSGYLKESPVVTVCDDQPDKSLCCECPEKPLHLFENLPPSYDPSTWWLDGQPSPYPHFQEAEIIQYHIKTIKQSLLRHILQGCRAILEAKGHHLLSSVKDHELLWKAAVSAQKYGVVYLASRRDCREEFLSAAESQPSLFAEISAFLSFNSNANRVINYGVHQLVNSQEFKVDHETRLIPPTAISAIGVNHIAVRERDFTGDGASMLDTPSAIWDLHDFAHLSAASMSPRLYGSKYFTHLNKLPPKLTALIRSPKMKTSEPSPRISDGVVFSEILTVLFTSEVQERANSHTYSSLTNVLADYVADYLMGTRELKHLTTGAMLKVKSPIRATELATLAQNKAYELTASEIEQRVFTRGGPVGDSKDELDSLSALERIEFLAGCRKWLYFEMRNTIKHRAHRLAYQKVAERMLASEATDVDRMLLESVLDNIRYREWEHDGTVNLWQLVKDLEGKGQG